MPMETYGGPRLVSPEPLLDEAFAAAVAGWPRLTQSGDELAFPLPGRFVAPGGFFDWFFYWDSCFTVLGLTASGLGSLPGSSWTAWWPRLRSSPWCPTTTRRGRSAAPDPSRPS